MRLHYEQPKQDHYRKLQIMTVKHVAQQRAMKNENLEQQKRLQDMS